MDKAKVVKRIYSKRVTLIVYFVYFVNCDEKQSKLIYVLLWTFTANQTWVYRPLEMGQKAFTSRNCTYQNCFITTNHSYFSSVLDFDVLIFNAVHFSHFPREYFPLPHNRSGSQLYVLACVEPAAYNFLPDYIKGIFNLTWTYKLNSDIAHPYFVVKNNMEEIIGPKRGIRWLNINDLPNINSVVMQKLKNKRLAALWVGSDCFSKNRIIYIKKLEKELESKHGLKLDIFGKCGNQSVCPRDFTTGDYNLLNKCYDIIESDYYFYLAFENSHSEDYVSEKVLHALNHLTVPIVYGGADYTR